MNYVLHDLDFKDLKHDDNLSDFIGPCASSLKFKNVRQTYCICTADLMLLSLKIKNGGAGRQAR